MIYKNTYAIAALFSCGIFLSTTIASHAGPSNGSNLGECYNNWITWCNDKTSGYPNSCYGESMDHCDSIHKAGMTQIPGLKVQSMRAAALGKAKRANSRVVAPSPQPVRIAN